MSPPVTGKPEQVDSWTGWAKRQAMAPSQLLPPVQAAALGVLQPGPRTTALLPWGCWSLGQASPVPPALSSSGALPQTSRPGRHLPLGTEASVQPQKKASFHSDVQCGAPGPSLKGWAGRRLPLLLELALSAADTSQLPWPSPL